METYLQCIYTQLLKNHCFTLHGWLYLIKIQIVKKRKQFNNTEYSSVKYILKVVSYQLLLPESKPPDENGSWTVSASCKHSCVFPQPLWPASSVIPLEGTPPLSSLSTWRHPVLKHLHLLLFLSMSSPVWIKHHLLRTAVFSRK